MGINEKWSVWEKDFIPKGSYELTKLLQDWNGVRITFQDTKIQVNIIYKDEILAIRSIDAEDRWKTVDEVLGKHGGDFFRQNLMFLVDNSEFKQWYIKENYDTRVENEIEHHVFATANDFIDVLALHSPVIQITKID